METIKISKGGKEAREGDGKGSGKGVAGTILGGEPSGAWKRKVLQMEEPTEIERNFESLLKNVKKDLAQSEDGGLRERNQ